jgi:hypothetical protein
VLGVDEFSKMTTAFSLLRSIEGQTTLRSLWRRPTVLTSPNCEPASQGGLLPRQIEKYVQINRRRNGMKALVAAIFAAGVSLTTLSSAQAITVTAAPLAEAAKETSSVVEVQGGGCERGSMMTPQGCRGISWNYKRSGKKSGKKKHKK